MVLCTFLAFFCCFSSQNFFLFQIKYQISPTEYQPITNVNWWFPTISGTVCKKRIHNGATSTCFTQHELDYKVQNLYLYIFAKLACQTPMIKLRAYVNLCLNQVVLAKLNHFFRKRLQTKYWTRMSYYRNTNTNNVGMIITCLWSWLDNIDDLGLVLASKITSSKFHA